MDTHYDSGNRQYAYQIPFSTRTGMSVMDTGMVISSGQSYVYPKAATPVSPSVWWNSRAWQYGWRIKVWDAWGLESPWSNGQDFEIIALERLRVSKIGNPPNGQPVPVLNDPATHIMIDYGTNPLPKIKANGMVVILVDSIGPVNTLPLGINFYYHDISTGEKTTATVHNLTALLPWGSATNRLSCEIWSRPEVIIAGDATVIRALLEGTTSVGNNAHLRVSAPYDIDVAQVLGTSYTDWSVVLKGRKN
ncbi:hypothetical protein DCCM_3759 [Desulfocucumis palustris]|uniref:Uncharacterized protein n=1 Tax=Desulfocucumis palustris TaxID=1898651 RepID=A0A2L2XE47_9FIRM|nr:hypothetical protein DCCM_3759 [Desulfocucumis palustris]